VNERRAQLENLAWAVVEQGTFSLAGFIANVMLARTLGKHEYGSFAMSYAVYVAFLQLQTALMGDPMLVFASGKYADRRAAYIASLLRAYWVLWPALALALLAVAHTPIVGLASSASAFKAMAVALPFLLFIHLMRRVGYASLSTKSAAKGAVSYTICVVFGMELLRRAGQLSVGTTYAVLALSSLGVATAWWRMQHHDRGEPAATPIPMRELIVTHWSYARWGAMASLLAWFPLHSWYLTVPIVAPRSGVSESGQLRALFNLVQPIIQANAAVATTLVPTFTRRVARAGDAKLSLRWAASLLAAPLVYCVGLVSLGPWAVRLLYGEEYDVDRATLLVLGLVPAFHALTGLLRSYCLAHGKPELSFQSAGLAAVASLSVGLPLCHAFGIVGAAAGMLAGFVAQVAWLGPRVRALG
jgi:O-antigen/teichoic acid export membrane protein